MKVAVTTGNISELGVETINSLLNQNYYVFSLTKENTYINKMSLLHNLSDLKIINGCVTECSDLSTLYKEVINLCHKNNTEVSIDLLVHFIDAGSEASLFELSSYELYLSMHKNIYCLYDGTIYLTQALQKATGKSNVIFVHPKVDTSNIKTLTDSLTSSCIGTLKQYFNNTLKSYNINTKSVTYDKSFTNAETISHLINEELEGV